jgi:hypothetical protein
VMGSMQQPFWSLFRPAKSKRSAHAVEHISPAMKIACGCCAPSRGAMRGPERWKRAIRPRLRAQGFDRAQKVIDAASCSSFFSRQIEKIATRT